MARLDRPKREGFSKDDFEQYPVWTWDDEREFHLPLSEAEPAVEDYDTLFIKSRFEAGGHCFDGYLVGGKTFYAFGFFVGDEVFSMNLGLPDLIDENVDEICNVLNCERFEIFPLRYSSPVRLKGGGPVCGTLTP